MKEQESLVYGILGVLIGAVIVWFFASSAVNTNNQRMMGMMGMRPYASNQCPMVSEKKNESMSMMEMMEGLSGKSGDEFDKTFIEEMIEHHQGAIDMAKEAQAYAGHDEIKDLANDIISAQEKEIEMMRQWQKDWGY